MMILVSSALAVTASATAADAHSSHGRKGGNGDFGFVAPKERSKVGHFRKGRKHGNHSGSSPVILTSGLNNPRQLSLVHDAVLLVAEAGKAGTACDPVNGCVGATGSVSCVLYPRSGDNRDHTELVTGFLSGAGPDGSFAVGSDVSLFHLFPNVVNDVTATPIADWPGFDPTPDFPGADFVPTSIAIGPHGDVYVGGLSSELPGQAEIVKLDGRSGDVEDTFTGFSTITGLAVDQHGTMYVSQLEAPEASTHRGSSGECVSDHAHALGIAAGGPSRTVPPLRSLVGVQRELAADAGVRFDDDRRVIAAEEPADQRPDRGAVPRCLRRVVGDGDVDDLRAAGSDVVDRTAEPVVPIETVVQERRQTRGRRGRVARHRRLYRIARRRHGRARDRRERRVLERHGVPRPHVDPALHRDLIFESAQEVGRGTLDRGQRVRASAGVDARTRISSPTPLALTERSPPPRYHPPAAFGV